MLNEIVFYSRMALGIRQFLRTTPIADAEAAIRHRLATRTTSFLELAERAVFGNPANPYQKMFQLAGCTYGDLVQEVNTKGLVAVLGQLRTEGVYLTHDEFKAKTPIVRSGVEIPAHERSFRNPQVAGALSEGVSSGSRSRGTRTPKPTSSRLHQEAWRRLHHREWQVENHVPLAIYPILPSTLSLISGLYQSRLGRPWDRWFATADGTSRSRHYRLVTNALVLASRSLGAQVPFPMFLERNDFTVAAEWIARRKHEGVSCLVSSFTSAAVRVAMTALEKGFDISGTAFVVGGEALTDTKRAVIDSVQAEVWPTYYISEVGCIGVACRQMRTGNCVHLSHEAVAVVNHRQPAPLSDVTVNALLFTTLLPFAPHVLINADMGDAGDIEAARCGCLFAGIGFRWQIRNIYSFGKLTGHGMTLVGTDLVRILEEALPACLGGSPTDYQLVEHEGRAQTQLTLRVSPRVRVSSPERAKECFLREIQRCYGGALASQTWRHAEGVTVKIAEPLTTRGGKVLPLFLLGTGKEAEDAS